jgi:predicted transcriptional regulator
MGNSKGAKPLTLAEVEKAKALSAHGHSYREIGTRLGRNDKTIKKALTGSPEVIQAVKEIKAVLAESFEDLAQRMIGSITDDDIGRLDAYKRTLAGAIATDKMQQLRGEVTQINVSVLLNAVQVAKEIQAQRAAEAMESVRRRMAGVLTQKGTLLEPNGRVPRESNPPAVPERVRLGACPSPSNLVF